MSKSSPKPLSDYLLIRPHKPEGGAFDVGATYIDEHGVLEAVGPLVTDDLKKLVGKKIIFNAWACDMKMVSNVRYYFAPQSSNCICALI